MWSWRLKSKISVRYETLSPKQVVAFWSLPVRAAYYLHQFRNLVALIGLVAGGDRVFHAMGDVIAQNFFLDAAERGAHSRNLCDEVDAIAVFVDHLREAAHLAFDS